MRNALNTFHAQKNISRTVGFFVVLGVLTMVFSHNKQTNVEITTGSLPAEPTFNPQSSSSPTLSSSPKPKISRITFVNWPAMDGTRTIDKIVISYTCDTEFRKRHGPQVEVVLIPLENNFLLDSDDAVLYKAIQSSQLVYVNAADVLSSSNTKEAKLKKILNVVKEIGLPMWINLDRISTDNTEWLTKQHIHWLSVKTEDAYFNLLLQKGFKQPVPEEKEHEAEFRWNEVDFEDQASFDTVLDENGADESTQDKEVHQVADLAFLLPYQPAMSRDQWMIQHSIWDRPDTLKVLLNGQIDGDINEDFFQTFLGLVKKSYPRAVFRVVSDFQDSEDEQQPIKASAINPPEYAYPATIAESLWFYSRASVVVTTGPYGGILARLTSTPAVLILTSKSKQILEFAATVNSPGYAFVDVKQSSTVEQKARSILDTLQRVLKYAEDHNLQQDGTVPRLSDSALDNFPMSHRKGDLASLTTIIDDVELDRQKSFHTAINTAAYQISKKQVPMLKFDKTRNQYLVKPMS